MALYGYARVSTNDQDLDLQIQTLHAAGCEIIRAEKARILTAAAGMVGLNCNCYWIFCDQATH